MVSAVAGFGPMRGVANFVHNSGTLVSQGVAGRGMEVLLGGFILVVVAIHLIAEARETVATEAQVNETNGTHMGDLEPIDTALFGVVFIVLVAGIALAAWSAF